MDLTKTTLFASNETYICPSDRIDFFPEDAQAVESADFPSVQTAFLLRGLSDVTLDFGGGTLCMHGDIQPFTLIDCRNVTIKNVIVEHQRSHYTEGEIVGWAPGRYRIRMNEKYPFDVRDRNLIVYGDGWRNDHIDQHPMMFMQYFEKDSRKGLGATLVSIGGTRPPHDKEHFRVRHLTAHKAGGDLVLKGGLWMRPLKKGTHIVFEHETRHTGTMLACRCDDLTLYNFRILNGSGMGIVPLCCHNVTLDRLLFTYDERSHGYVSNAADGLHTFACSGALVLNDCIFEGMIDDALNIHGNYYVLQSIEGNSAIVRCGSLSFSEGTDHGEYYFPLRVSDRISINVGKTMDIRDQYAILDITRRPDGLVQLALDRPPLGESGDLVEDLSAQVDLTMTNCVFAKTNTHLRFQTRGKVLIRDCITELPFWLTGDTTYWYESSPCTDFTVRNCRFVGRHTGIMLSPEITPTATTPYYHRNVTIEDCSFDTRLPLNALRSDNITFRRNTHSRGRRMTILARNCGAITTDNARIVRIK